jgi:predicted ATP-grasp superfamily ATP-dependent carboligase
MNKDRAGVVILGGDFQALGAVRSLAVHDIPVILVDADINIARYSRYLKGRIRLPRLQEPHLFAQRLIALARSRNLKGWVLLPNNDELVMLIAKNRDILSEHFAVPIPSWPVVRKFYYKDAAYELAQKISVPVPRIYSGRTVEEIMDQRPVFPLVLKPRAKERYYPKTRRKAVRVDTPAALRREYQAMAAIIDPGEIVVQEFLPGGGKNLYSFAGLFDGNRIVAGMAANRLRQHPREFGHATTYAVSVDIPELREYAERLLREIGFYGIAEVEFMKDEREGVFKFIEINGRIWGWHTLAKAAGINLPFLLYRHLMGEEIKPVSARNGAKWIRLITDVPTCVQDILDGRMSLKEYWSSMSGPREFAVFSRRDPIPFFMEIALIPYLWWKRGF